MATYPSSNFRNLLEIFYFVSTPLLLIVAVIGLKQLSISKNSARTNAKREAFKLAAERCSYYLEHIIPKLNLLDKLIDEKEIKGFGEAEVKVIDTRIAVSYKPNEEEFEKIIEILSEILTVLNALEAFSVFFTSRVAEERVAFSSIGYSYCNSIEKLLPLICAGNGEGFTNILRLYVLWNDRIQKQEAFQEKVRAEEKLNQTCAINLKSIGT